MAEYICREAILKKLQMQLLDLEADQDKGEYSELCENRGARDALDEAIYDIRSIKAADVQPMKRGSWIAENRDNRGYADCYTCTNCNCYTYTYTLMKDCEYDYCPNCGARMDLKDGDTE